MQIFMIRFVEGGSIEVLGREDFLGPLRQRRYVQAKSRAEAYIAAYRYFSAQGQDVACMQVGGAPPLDFGQQDLREIRAAGVTLKGGYPKQGIQIEEILELSTRNDRPRVALPGLPDIIVSSAEDEAGGMWTIFYTLEKDDVRSICFPVGESEVEGLIGQARETALREERPFDLARARQVAADQIVARQILSYECRRKASRGGDD